MIKVKSLMNVKNWGCVRKQFKEKLGNSLRTSYLCIVIQRVS